MEESIPTKPSTVVSVAELIKKLQRRQDENETNWSYRVQGFLYEDVNDPSGFGFLLSSSKRLTSSSEAVKISTRKIVPWPEDVRDGDLVQVVVTLQRCFSRDYAVDALSLVRTTDLDTEFELNLLRTSYDQLLRFMERPRQKTPSLAELYLKDGARNSNSSLASLHENSTMQSRITSVSSTKSSIASSTTPKDFSVISDAVSTLEDNKNDDDSLFEDEVDMDTAHLIERLDRLSSSTSDGENRTQTIDSTSGLFDASHRQNVLNSNGGGLIVSASSGATSISTHSAVATSPFLIPPIPSTCGRTSSTFSASKNAGKFSRKPNLRRMDST